MGSSFDVMQESIIVFGGGAVCIKLEAEIWLVPELLDDRELFSKDDLRKSSLRLCPGTSWGWLLVWTTVTRKNILP